MEGHLFHVYSHVFTLDPLYAENTTVSLHLSELRYLTCSHRVLCVLVQVILVQVNPGETFTIRAEDGSLQCIQGKFLLCYHPPPHPLPSLSLSGSICEKGIPPLLWNRVSR